MQHKSRLYLLIDVFNWSIDKDIGSSHLDTKMPKVYNNKYLGQCFSNCQCIGLSVAICQDMDK